MTSKTVTTTSTSMVNNKKRSSDGLQHHSYRPHVNEDVDGIIDVDMNGDGDMDIDVESKQMFESNERRLKFLEQEIVRLSKTLNRPVLDVEIGISSKTPNQSYDDYAVTRKQ